MIEELLTPLVLETFIEKSPLSVISLITILSLAKIVLRLADTIKEMNKDVTANNTMLVSSIVSTSHTRQFRDTPEDPGPN